ncbi:hypothetical protein GH714_008752 [Hevea brasiliensis]|uniref:Serine aminopeptidase S33 domain-containing protein n=1 Tax=Hevea brasiliensis TaxID=3981 RepID=A0A6A6N1L3_HEVBR|nr:hypothetical protein GH714_008752 [Hevea brasiliensis]
MAFRAFAFHSRCGDAHLVRSSHSRIVAFCLIQGVVEAEVSCVEPRRVVMRPRAATAFELLRVCRDLQGSFEKVEVPLLIVHGGDDVVCDPACVEELHRRASSKDKTLKIYPGMWHQLVGEPEESVNLVHVQQVVSEPSLIFERPEYSFGTGPPPVFDGQNYQLWAVKMKTYLRGFDLWEVVETGNGPPPLRANPTVTQLKHYAEESAKKYKSLSIIHAAVTETIFTRIMACDTGKEAWDRLKEEFQGSEKTKQMQVLNLRREYELLKMKEVNQ